MSWDSGNNANGGDSWGAGGGSGGGQWDGGNSTPWDGGSSTPWGGSGDAAGGQDNNPFASGNFGGGEFATSNDTSNDYGASGDYGSGGDYGGGDDYDSRPARTPRPGDWDCPDCGVNNFASRDACFKCSAPRPEGMGRPKREPRPGDWDCPSCGVNNFASRQECFKCNEPRPEGMGPPKREPRPGDWDCPSCNINNFGTRTECFKCGAARPEGMGVPPPEDRPERAYNWASNRARYEFNENAIGEDGMAPRDEKLEAELFGFDPTEQHTPLDFSKYANIPINIERGEAPAPVKDFDSANLHPVMKENIRLARYTQPTPVQTMSIPIVTNGKDLMACAQTGSGKTAAFLIPTLSGLFGRAKELAQPRPAPFEYRSFKAEPLVVIIAPTRELCSQIFDECRKFTYRSMLRPCAVYGGADTLSQIRQLERGCDILAASPGRLMDFIERGKISLKRVRYLVLDEADRMLDMGFEAVIRAIVEKRGLNPERQTLMYSATFPRAIRKLARDFLQPDYLFLKVGRVGGTTSSITQKMLYVEEENKREELRTLLNSQPPSRTLIFVETKRSADSLDQYLYERGFPSTSIHGDRTQMEREDALIAFKHGRCPILVATAVAARGIDIRNVMHVINYDMPESMDEYIHRIGRTARVGRSGLATSFYNERTSHLAPELAKLLKECKQEIPEFLQMYIPEDITWEEDLPEEDVPAPSYAGQEYVPMERPGFGAPPGAPAGGDAHGDSAGGAPAREGDWNCPSCGINNYARRTECFKCNTPNPNPSTGGGGGARERRDGDWDCTCGVVNYARRTECFKCGAQREGGAGGDDYGYGASGDYGAGTADAGTAGWDANAASAGWDSGNNGATGGGWDANAASAGWDSGNNAAPATGGGWGEPAATQAAPAAGGGWGEPAPAQQPAPAAGGGWGEPAPAQQPAPAAGGWGEPAPAQQPAPAGGGWGEPQQQQASPAQQPVSTSGGWGEPAPAQQPAPQAAGGWGEPQKQPSPAPQAAGGWGEPQQQQSPAQQPAAANGGWGEPAPKQPAAQQPASGGWGEPAAPTPQQPPVSNGWGSPAPPAQTPPAAATPPPQQQPPAPAAQPAPAAPAPAADDGWGAAPAQPAGDGWGAPPAKPDGFGW